MRYDVTIVESPFGRIVVATTDEGVHAIEFSESESPADWRFARRLGNPEFERNDGGRDVAEQLTEYFAGDLEAPDAVRVAAEGTPFQCSVWSALREIPPGETVTYGRLAAQIGRPDAARAVGRANATNPVAVVVPCHRVVGADGALVGYAAGVERKRRLLEHERAATIAAWRTSAADPLPVSSPD